MLIARSAPPFLAAKFLSTIFRHEVFIKTRVSGRSLSGPTGVRLTAMLDCTFRGTDACTCKSHGRSHPDYRSAAEFRSDYAAPTHRAEFCRRSVIGKIGRAHV